MAGAPYLMFLEQPDTAIIVYGCLSILQSMTIYCETLDSSRGASLIVLTDCSVPAGRLKTPPRYWFADPGTQERATAWVRWR